MITHQQILNAKILIVDDEPANVMILEETLKQKGHSSIETITDSREALESFKNFRPDLVLLDLNMPHLNGFQVMEQIKEADSKGNTPIMMLTAQIDQGTRLAGSGFRSTGFSDKTF